MYTITHGETIKWTVTNLPTFRVHFQWMYCFINYYYRYHRNA